MKKSRQSSKFGVDAYHYQHELYDELNSFVADIPFYMKWAKKSKGRVLELCCGTGRITLPLKEAGIDVTGVDFTPSMLEGAAQKASKKNLDLPLVRQDMRKLKLGQKFDLIFIPFNSIQNTYTIEDIEKVFAGAKAHLKPRGKFIIDIFNPSISLMYERARKPMKQRDSKLSTGERVKLFEKTEYNSAEQILRVYWTYQFGSKKPFTRTLDMRCFYPQEMDALLKYNGFKVLKKFGDFSEGAFTSSSAKQIFVCEVAK
jgi:ubiquinone/menaquinone biosynthesis C-methylase UbiE